MHWLTTDHQVTYAVSTLRSAFGDNRLMPRPDFDCMVINAESGYKRTSKSWVLARLLRDFGYWRPPVCDQESQETLSHIRDRNKGERTRLELQKKLALSEDERRAIDRGLASLPSDDEIRIGLRITVWECRAGTSRAGDWIYWVGIVVSVVQLTISILPLCLYGEWITILVTASGTALAYMSAMLPQWVDEKFGVRSLSREKRMFLTEGNGAEEVLMIISHRGSLDIEALASSRRALRSSLQTRALSVLLAAMWMALLVTVTGWGRHSWFLIAVGMTGIFHNVTVAGTSRRPQAWGLDLHYQQTIAETKVMQALHRAEELFPRAGLSLLSEFFPGEMRPRETLIWEFARQRYVTWKAAGCPVDACGCAIAWRMPPLLRTGGVQNDDDIPHAGDLASDTPSFTGYDIGPVSVSSRPSNLSNQGDKCRGAS